MYLGLLLITDLFKTETFSKTTFFDLFDFLSFFIALDYLKPLFKDFSSNEFPIEIPNGFGIFSEMKKIIDQWMEEKEMFKASSFWIKSSSHSIQFMVLCNVLKNWTLKRYL